MKTFFLFELFLLLILLTGFIFGQEQKIAIKFNEEMDRTTLFDIDNWNVYDSELNEVSINRIGVVEDNTVAIIYTPFLKYKTNFIVRVINVKDKAGNLINSTKNSAWFFVDGFDSTAVTPVLILPK